MKISVLPVSSGIFIPFASWSVQTFDFTLGLQSYMYALVQKARKNNIFFFHKERKKEYVHLPSPTFVQAIMLI